MMSYECRMNREHCSIGLNEKLEGSRDENIVITKQINYVRYFRNKK